MGTRHTIKQIEAALCQADGQPSLAARDLGISRQAIHERIHSSPRLQAVMEEIRAEMLELAEGNIAKALRAGDMAVTRWYLERKGRHLGYSPKCEPVDPALVESLVAACQGDLVRLKACRDLLQDA